MSIRAVGIQPKSGSSYPSAYLAIASTDSAPAMKVAMRTDFNDYTKFDLVIGIDVVKKAGNSDYSGYTNIGEVKITGIAATNASFTVTGNDASGYLRQLPFSAFTNLASKIGTLTYSARSYDAFRLTITVRGYVNTTLESQLSNTIYIEFLPPYALGSPIVWDGEGLHIPYTASGWDRPDDTFQIVSSTITDQEGNILVDTRLPNPSVEGVVDGFGSILVPIDKFIRVPMADSNGAASFKIYLGSSWRSSSLGSISGSNAPVVNAYVLRNPTLTIEADGDRLRFKVGETGSGTQFDSVVVKMVGSDWDIDRIEGAKNTWLYAPAVPYGVKTKWQAYGLAEVSGELVASHMILVQNAPIITASGFSITPEDGSDTLRVPYSVPTNSQTKPEMESVKLAGRERMTVGFGEGGTVNWTLSGKVVDSSFAGLYGNASMETTNIEALRNVAFHGICVIRMEEGERARVAITNCSISKTLDGKHRRSVNLTGVEVS